MITIPDTTFTSDYHLSSFLQVLTKAEMLEICKKLDLYVSPNVKKAETARRVAEEILSSPISVCYQLCKAELELLDEIVKAGPNRYVVRKMRKMPYKLQKFGMVLTYEDVANQQWHILMPDEVRESLSQTYGVYLKLAQDGQKGPSPKELRRMSFLASLYGEE
jgi:hypothetical protein